MDEDLPHVRDGAKVSMGEMEKDIGLLRNGLAEVSREIEFHRGAGPTQPGDKFLAVMCEFQAQATVRITELEDKFQDMKTRSVLYSIYSKRFQRANLIIRIFQIYSSDLTALFASLGRMAH